MSCLPDYCFEKKYGSHYKYIAGIDEAGRGALAGPVVAAAVILPDYDLSFLGINDSKLLSFQKRLQLYNEIISNAVAYKTSFSDNIEIDNNNILKQTIHSMHNAALTLEPNANLLLIDGNHFKGCGIPYRTIINGDAKCISIAAASILAKVERDLWMIDIADNLYPDYGFARHKGYGTKEHIAAIKKIGPCPIHRKTFLKKYLLPEGLMLEFHI